MAEPARHIPSEAFVFALTEGQTALRGYCQASLGHGEEAIEGAMRIAEPTERSMPNKVVDGERLLIFPERESVQRPAAFVVSATEPGAYHIPKGLKQQIPLDT
ncbi:MAG: hypothetical protein H7Z17_07925, partial [Fuerstia sp.]|nr:hypothetical protein [Fuerstiella sp.]